MSGRYLTVELRGVEPKTSESQIQLSKYYNTTPVLLFKRLMFVQRLQQLVDPSAPAIRRFMTEVIGNKVLLTTRGFTPTH